MLTSPARRATALCALLFLAACHAPAPAPIRPVDERLPSSIVAPEAAEVALPSSGLLGVED